MVEPGAAQPPFRRIGKYELHAAIGDGGMGRVFRARMRGPAAATREVALKLLHPHLCHDRDFVLMFLDEVRLTMALSHRNIVQTFDADKVDGQYYLVMELVEGCSLRDLMRVTPDREPAPVDIVLFIGLELCAALDYAHGFSASGVHGLVHRDISPANILLSVQGDVKLADFGVAKAAGRLSVSVAGSVKGKLGYMAPEQARGEVTPASDLFSLGAVMYELLCGRSIRDSVDLEVIREGREIPALISRLRPEVPASLESLVMSCLRTDPSERPASAGALREALAQESFRLEVSERRGPDAHARLRRFLSERLAPSAEVVPASDPGQQLARLLLQRAREEPEPPTTSLTTEAVTQPRAGEDETETLVDHGVPTALHATRRVHPSRSPTHRTTSLRGLAVLVVVVAGLAVAWLIAGERPAPIAPPPDGGTLVEVGAPRSKASPDLHLEARPDRALPDLPAAPAPEAQAPRPRPRSGGSSARPRPSPRPEAPPGQIWVMTRKEGRLQWAEVFLDGRRVGPSPIRLEKVAPGEHLLEVRRRGFRTETRRVTVASGVERSVFFELRTDP